MSRPGRALRWLAGIGLVAALVLSLDPHLVADRLRGAALLPVAAGVAGLVAVHLLGAAAWRAISDRGGGPRLAWRRWMALHYAAQAIGGLTPANLGGDAYRLVALHRAGAEWSTAGLTVLVQRATSYLALAALALPAIAWLWFSAPATRGVLGAALALSLAAVGVALLLLVAPGRLPGNPAVVGRRAAAAQLGAGTAYGLAFHLLAALLGWLLMAAVDPSAAAPSVLAAVLVARLSLALPFLPSGLGANEAALAVLFGGIGLAPEVALAGALLARLGLVATTALGALLLAVGPMRGSGADRVPDRLGLGELADQVG